MWKLSNVLAMFIGLLTGGKTSAFITYCGVTGCHKHSMEYAFITWQYHDSGVQPQVS